MDPVLLLARGEPAAPALVLAFGIAALVHAWWIWTGRGMRYQDRWPWYSRMSYETFHLVHHRIGGAIVAVFGVAAVVSALVEFAV